MFIIINRAVRARLLQSTTYKSLGRARAGNKLLELVPVSEISVESFCCYYKPIKINKFSPIYLNGFKNN